MKIINEFAFALVGAIAAAFVTESIEKGVILFLFIIGIFYFRKRYEHYKAKKDMKTNILEFLNLQAKNALGVKLPTSDDVCNLLVRDIVNNDKIYLEPEIKNCPYNPRDLSLVEYLVNNFFQPVIQDNKNFLLLGEPGSGKTIILKRMFFILKSKFENENSDLVPIYLPFETDLNILEGDISQNLYDFLTNHHSLDLSYEEFHSLEEENKIILLIDGLDEVSGKLDTNLVNKITRSSLFLYPCVLSCRTNIFESCFSSFLSKNPFKKIELKPLVFGDTLKQYIRNFCEQANFEEASESIIQKIENDPKLVALSTNHLMLFMIMNIFSDPQEIQKRDWTRAKVYDVHIQKWMLAERDKVTSSLTDDEKILFLTELAWHKYKSKTASLCYKDGYIDVKFTEKEITDYLNEIYNELRENDIRLQTLSINNVLDDILHQTLLTSRIEVDEKYYSFFHKSYQEYFVAKHIFSKLIESTESTIESFKSIIPIEISSFLKDKLCECKSSGDRDLSLISNNLMQAYIVSKKHPEMCEYELAREHACYYLARLGEDQYANFLENVYIDEPSLYVQRGILMGLILFYGRKNYLEKYAEILNSNDEASSINLGYHLIYYGDQLFEQDFHDSKNIKCDGTIQAIMRHLNSESHRLGWTIDLITLKTLMRDKDRDAVNIIQEKGYKGFLQRFLREEHVDQGKAFHNEKAQISEYIGESDNG